MANQAPSRATRPKRARRPSRVGVPYKKSEETREHLLATAIQLIAKKGLAGTSFTEIAEAAGVSKGGISYYFESKDELLQSVLDRSCEVMEKRVKDAFFGGDVGPLERVQHALAEMWALRRDGVAEMRAMTELHVVSRQDATLRRAFAGALQRARQQMIDAGLNNLLLMGIKPKVDADLVPRLIMGVLDGLALQHEVDPIPAEKQGELLQAISLSIVGLFDIGA